ncbi:MAG: ABC transporter substrate-binding protein [Anaerolineae bacterium]|nr:ABC transporter substrate-binding protein [Anaerolineae bacterium]
MTKDKLVKVVVIVLWLVALALSGCTSAGPATAPASRRVTLSMGFIPNVQFTPVYVAVERGYFAEEGLEVEFDYGFDTDLLKLVGTGERQFVVGSGDQVILARSQGLPVVYVMNWYRRFPVAVASLQPLNSPQDLVGKKVGIPAFQGASYIGWLALLDAAGISPGEVELQSIGYTQVESLVTGQVDAAVVYAMNEPVQLCQEGYEVSVIPVADYIDFVSNGLITNEKTIAEEPELVRGIVRAMLRGLRDTLDDPDAAFDICRRYVPEIDDESAPLQRAVLQESINFWRADDLGRSDAAAWQASQAFMRQIGLIETEVEVSTLFTNDFIPEP